MSMKMHHIIILYNQCCYIALLTLYLSNFFFVLLICNKELSPASVDHSNDTPIQCCCCVDACVVMNRNIQKSDFRQIVSHVFYCTCATAKIILASALSKFCIGEHRENLIRGNKSCIWRKLNIWILPVHQVLQNIRLVVALKVFWKDEHHYK